MMLVLDSTLSLCLGYIIGSIPFGFLFARAGRDVDPRSVGSQSIGAANVTRTAGYGLGFLTLVADCSKGFCAVFLAQMLFASEEWVLVTALAVVVGHMYPIWLRYRGGKGIATLFGVLLFLAFDIAVLLFLLWLISLLIFRYVSVASLLVAFFLPFCVYVLRADSFFLLTVCFLSLLIFWRHRSNIRRLLSGQEPSLSRRPRS